MGRRSGSVGVPAALVLSLAGAATSVAASAGAMARPVSPISDFAAFWRAGRWILEGRLGSLYPDMSFGDAGPGTFKGFLNPPHVAVLLSPFARFSLGHAKVAFAVLNLLITAGLLVSAWRLLTRQGHPIIARVTALALLVACPAVASSFVNGTLSLLVVAATGMIVRADLVGRAARDASSVGAGRSAFRVSQEVLIATGLGLLSIKPQYAVLPTAFLLGRGRWRVVAGGTLVTGLLMFATVPSTGLAPWREYLPFLGRYADTMDVWDVRQTKNLWLPRQMLNVRGVLFRLLGDGSVPFVNAMSVVVLLSGIAAAIVLGRAVRSGNIPAARAWAAVLVLAILTSQHANLSDGVLVLLALLLASRSTGWLMALAAFDLALLFGNPSNATPAAPWSGFAIAVLAAWVLLTGRRGGEGVRKVSWRPHRSVVSVGALQRRTAGVDGQDR